MALTIDYLNASMVIHSDDTIALDGHHFTYQFHPYHEENEHCGVTVECLYCNEEYHLGGMMSKAQAWTALFYLLGNVESACIGDIEAIRDTVNNEIMPNYIGEVADDQTRQRIEGEIHSKISDSVDVEFR